MDRMHSPEPYGRVPDCTLFWSCPSVLARRRSPLPEVGGNPAVRPYWARYAKGIAGVVYVLDARAEEGLAALGAFLQDPLCTARSADLWAAQPK